MPIMTSFPFLLVPGKREGGGHYRLLKQEKLHMGVGMGMRVSGHITVGQGPAASSLGKENKLFDLV